MIRIAFLPAGRLGPLQAIGRAVTQMRERRAERRAVLALLDVDDAILKDIGLRRHEVVIAAGMPENRGFAFLRACRAEAEARAQKA